MPDDKQTPLFPINQLRKQLEKEVEKFNQLASHIHNPHNPELNTHIKTASELTEKLIALLTFSEHAPEDINQGHNSDR
ncbi:MAG TPA: hypothetical protein VIM85_11005 [Pseudomonadales bacterium]